jgi:MoxR-like ATPase
MDVQPANEAALQSVNVILSRARAEVAKVIIGQQRVVDFCLIAIFTGNHILIEGVPGVAKTLLVRTLAKVLGADFSRIQFTPDLMPSDITGTSVFNLQEGAFHLVKGPIFTSFLLADEINRAPAKTQSALLQAMQERLVTIDGKTYELPASFTVFATQNPIEYEGTYPLPEAQKDRFLLRVEMDYPTAEEELQLAVASLGQATPEHLLAGDTIEPVLTEPQIQKIRCRDRAPLPRTRQHPDRSWTSCHPRSPTLEPCPRRDRRSRLRHSGRHPFDGLPRAFPPHHPAPRIRDRGRHGARGGEQTPRSGRGAAIGPIRDRSRCAWCPISPCSGSLSSS